MKLTSKVNYHRNLYIEKLENDLRELKREIERIRKEDQMALESLHNQIQELENEIIVQKQIISSTTQVLLLNFYSMHNIYN